MIQAIGRIRIITSVLLLLAVSVSLIWNIFHFRRHQLDPAQATDNLQVLFWPLIISHILAAMAGLIIIAIFARKLSKERRNLEKKHEQLQSEIEERKKTETELHAAKENLESRVQKRTSELQQINTILSESLEAQQQTEESLSQTTRHLRQRNRELSDFTHAISHDLKEPLILIQAFCDRLQKCHDNLDEKGINYLERIETSTQRMQGLIDGLLLYSRIDRISQAFEPLHLNKVIRDVLDDLAVKIEENQAEILVDKLGDIEADPLQMRQLFQNIIGNSLKYRNLEKQPTIRIHLQPFSNEAQNLTHIRLSIQDNGIGFDSKYAEKIFDIFQRLHSREEINGSGIGLSICKKILDRHHGTITASSQPGQGTNVTLTLPRSQTQDTTESLPVK